MQKRLRSRKRGSVRSHIKCSVLPCSLKPCQVWAFFLTAKTCKVWGVCPWIPPLKNISVLPRVDAQLFAEWKHRTLSTCPKSFMGFRKTVMTVLKAWEQITLSSYLNKSFFHCFGKFNSYQLKTFYLDPRGDYVTADLITRKFYECAQMSAFLYKIQGWR